MMADIRAITGSLCRARASFTCRTTGRVHARAPTPISADPLAEPHQHSAETAAVLIVDEGPVQRGQRQWQPVLGATCFVVGRRRSERFGVRFHKMARGE